MALLASLVVASGAASRGNRNPRRACFAGLTRCPQGLNARCGKFLVPLDRTGRVAGATRVRLEYYPRTDTGRPQLGTIVAIPGARRGGHFPRSTYLEARNIGHVTALYDADACAANIVRRWMQTVATGDTSCLTRSPSTVSCSASRRVPPTRPRRPSPRPRTARRRPTDGPRGSRSRRSPTSSTAGTRGTTRSGAQGAQARVTGTIGGRAVDLSPPAPSHS